MDSVNIVNEKGQLLKAQVPFVRAPVVGEWVAAGRQWNQVVGVAHGWNNDVPVITIKIAPPAPQQHNKELPAPDDFVPIP